MPTFPPSDQISLAWAGGLLQVAGATDVGSVRRINQDAYGHFHDAERGESLFVVADGLGGHRGGEVASRMAIEALCQRIGEGDESPPIRLARAISIANQEILARSRKDRTLDGMGTTIVCLLLVANGRSYVAHVGDSRLYRVRLGQIDGITEDHSLVAALVREGVLSLADARSDPRRNQVLRALGMRDDVEIEVAPLLPMPGDLYLLCSDGLHGLIEDPEILRIIASQSEPEPGVAALLSAANHAGGNDNITCLIASLSENTKLPMFRFRMTRFVTFIRSLLKKARS